MTARRPWPGEFPNVVVHTSEASRDAHPDYLAAKAGQRESAIRLVCTLLSDAAVDEIRHYLGIQKPTLVPVRALEISSINLIPEAMAHEIGQRLGLAVTTRIQQTNRVRHTRARGFHRLAFAPTFAGQVTEGRACLLVDDHVGLGGTLASLRAHIESHGGRVLLTTTLSASRGSEVLALRRETLQDLRRKHGDALERDWEEEFGYGLDALTEAEAGYLFRQPSLDAIRARLARARGRGVPERLPGDQDGGTVRK
jgi:hypothetical protein